MSEGIGDRFQKETKYYRNKIPGGTPDIFTRPELYKEYPEAKKIHFPSHKKIHTLSLDDCLKQRKSIRQFTLEPLSHARLSYLLWASTGIQRKESSYEFRTAPSAGALYPIETYSVINRVDGLEVGLYHYNIKKHYLEEIESGDFREVTTLAALGQEMCATAPVVFIWTAIFNRSKWKYKQRAYRYIYLDAGHIAENLALAATGIGLGSCQIGALFDDELNEMLKIDGEGESVIYMSVVGQPG